MHWNCISTIILKIMWVLCSALFTQSEYLKEHSRMHIGEKRYKGGVYSAKLKRRDDMMQIVIKRMTFVILLSYRNIAAKVQQHQPS